MSSSRITTVRHLLKLAAVGTPPEAEIARVRAAEIMSRHGIAAEDVADDEVELVIDDLGQDKRDFYREELARSISRSRNLNGALTRRVDGRQLIYLRGPKDATTDARDLYRSLVEAAERRAAFADPLAYSDPDPAVRRLWRACFWMGFVRVVDERLSKSHQRWATAEAAPDPQAAKRAQDAAEDILASIDMLPPGVALPLKDRALAAGSTEGWTASVPPWLPRVRPRGLLPPGTCPSCDGCRASRQKEVEDLRQRDLIRVEEIERLKRRVEELAEYTEDDEEDEAEEERLRQTVTRLERELLIEKANLIEARREVAHLQTALRALADVPPIDGLDLDLDVDLDDVRDPFSDADRWSRRY